MTIPYICLGNSTELAINDQVVVAGFGGRRGSVKGSVFAKREFAGYWEYVLDEAIFVSPPHPFWGGAGLIGPNGTLLGIGSLFVQQSTDEKNSVDGNMVVPINLLKPILDDLLTSGQRKNPQRPWVGMLTAESDGKLIVGGLFNGGPADQIGIQVGDCIAEVAKKPVNSLANLFRSIWKLGDAGVNVPLTIIRNGQKIHIQITSACRNDFYIKPQYIPGRKSHGCCNEAPPPQLRRLRYLREMLLQELHRQIRRVGQNWLVLERARQDASRDSVLDLLGLCHHLQQA